MESILFLYILDTRMVVTKTPDIVMSGIPDGGGPMEMLAVPAGIDRRQGAVSASSTLTACQCPIISLITPSAQWIDVRCA